MSTSVRVDAYPNCDLCSALGEGPTKAAYDGKTTQGPWAYMCQRHFDVYGVGLGMGRGQILMLKENSK